jgi:xanthine dehydrogenase YagR molybdenum-binding subunit
MRLLEHTVHDPIHGQVVTNNLADYLVPVNPDIPTIDCFFVEEEDKVVNPLGIKGIGELGITGIAAAISNAVYHATGIRVRDLPITIDKLPYIVIGAAGKAITVTSHTSFHPRTGELK